MPTLFQLLREAYADWNDPSVLARTGRELHDRNRLPQARAILRRAVDLAPDDVASWARLSYCHLRGFDAPGGLAVLREGIEKTGSDSLRSTLAGFTPDEKERAELEAALANSDDPEVRAEAASRAFSRGDQAALDQVRRIAEKHPDNASVRETLMWTLLHAKGGGKAEVDLHEVGLPLADRAIAIDPDRHLATWIKTQMLLAEKDWDGLLAATEQALERFPDAETMMQDRGQAFREKGDLDRAAQCFARAIGMKPGFVGARIDLARLYESQDKQELAEELFREIPRANPDYKAGPMSLALFLARRERWEEAEEIVRETWLEIPAWQQAGLRNHPGAKVLFAREALKDLVAPSERA